MPKFKLTNSKQDYSKEDIKKVLDLLRAVETRVKNKGKIRYYDSKLKVVADGDSIASTSRDFKSYVEQDPEKRAGEMSYYVKVAFERAGNSSYLFENGAITIYAEMYSAHIDPRGNVDFCLVRTIKDLPMAKRANVVSSVFYKPSQIMDFKISHMKSMAESQFTHKYKGSLDAYPVTKMYWFKKNKK